MSMFLFLLLLLLVALTSTGAAAVGTLCDLRDVCTCDRGAGKVDCSCLRSGTKELTVAAPGLPSNAVSLRLSGCPRVTFAADAIWAPPFLRRVEVSDVGDLAVLSRGLARPGGAAFPSEDDRGAAPAAATPGLSLSLRRCNVTRLESDAVRGRLDDVELRECHVGGVAPFAFAGIDGAERLLLANCTFRRVAPRAFRRFGVAHLLVRGGAFPDGLPGRAFSDVDARRSFRLEGVALGPLDAWAFVVGDAVADFAVVGCRLERVATHAFNVTLGGAARVQGNAFAYLADQAFGAVVADRRSRVAGDAPELLFRDNSVARAETGFLDAGDGAGVVVSVSRLRVGDACRCDSLAEWAALLSKRRPPPLAPEELLCGGGAGLRFADFRDAHCGAAPGVLWLVLGIALPLGAVLVAAPCVCLWLLRRRRRRRRGKVSFGPQKGLVMPEAKTYRETELHVFMEKAEPLVAEQDTK